MTRLPAKTSGPVRASEAGAAPPMRAATSNCDDGAPDGTSDEVRGAMLTLLRFPAVRERTGLSRSTIWRLERQGAFPRHHRISANAVAWVEDDIAEWIQAKVSRVAV